MPVHPLNRQGLHWFWRHSLSGQIQEAQISPFLRDLPTDFYSESKPVINISTRASVAKILGKPVPIEAMPIDEEEEKEEKVEVAKR